MIDKGKKGHATARRGREGFGGFTFLGFFTKIRFRRLVKLPEFFMGA